MKTKHVKLQLQTEGDAYGTQYLTRPLFQLQYLQGEVPFRLRHIDKDRRYHSSNAGAR